MPRSVAELLPSIAAATSRLDGLATAAQVAAQLIPEGAVKTSNFVLTAGLLDRVNSGAGPFEATFPDGADAPFGCRVGLALLDISNPITLKVTDGSLVDGLDLGANTYQIDGPAGSTLAWRRDSPSSWTYDGLTGTLGDTGVSDHGALTGLTDDDHSQYARADGTRGAFATVGQGLLAGTALQPGAVLPMADVTSPLEPSPLSTAGVHTLGPTTHHHRLVRALPATALGEVVATVPSTAAAPFACELAHDEATGVAAVTGPSLRSSVGFAVPWNPLASKLFMAPYATFHIRRHASGRVYVNGPLRQLTSDPALDPEALHGVGGLSVIGWDVNRSGVTIPVATGISSITTRVATGHDLVQATAANQPTVVGTSGGDDRGARFVDSSDTITSSAGTEMPALGKNYCLILVCRLQTQAVGENNIMTLGDGVGVTPSGQILFRIIGSGTGMSLYIYNSSFQSRGTTLPATAFDNNRMIIAVNVADTGAGTAGTVNYYAFHEVLGYIVRSQASNITFSAIGNSGNYLTLRYVIPWTFHSFYRLHGAAVTEAQVERMIRYLTQDWMADVGAI